MSRIEMEGRIAALEAKAKNLQTQVNGLHADLANLAGRMERLKTIFKEWLHRMEQEVLSGRK